jgi:hypothetical protein
MRAGPGASPVRCTTSHQYLQMKNNTCFHQQIVDEILESGTMFNKETVTDQERGLG